MKYFFEKYALLLAWLIALIAMLSTVFASEILNWPVCPLCWYQRVCIYPLVILLGMAAYKNEKMIVPYVMPFPVLGFLFAAYQYAEQMIPGFEPIHFCTQGIACSAIHLKLLGFVTIPFLSMVACGMIVVLLVSIRSHSH